MAPKLAENDWDPALELPPDFLELPHKIYANDPNWIPEDRDLVRKAFDQQNPYFKRNQVFVTASPNLRLAGFYNPDLVVDGKKPCFFGYWETTDDAAENLKAFSELEKWALSKGAEHIYGPINFTTYGDYRLRIDGFDHPQFIGEPYNPNYYPELMKSLGFRERYRYFTACCKVETLASAAKVQMGSLEERLSTEGIRVERLTPEFWMENLEQLYPFIDSIFSQNFAYSPITYDQFVAYCGEKFAKKFCTKMSNIAIKGDQIVAFQLFYPDYSPLVTQAAKSPIPQAELDYRKHFDLLPKPRTFLGKTLGTLPEFRSKGLFYYLGFYGSLQAVGHYQYGYGAMVRDDNHSAVVKQFADHCHHYALYSKAL